MNKETILQILKENQSFLSKEYGVKRIGLFGSFSRETNTQYSDIDLVIEFSQPIGFQFIDLADYLEAILGVSVDILTPAGIEGIRIPHIAKEIRESIVYV